MYNANTGHSLFKDIQSVVKKYIGIDNLAEELVGKLGYVQAAYVIGDYEKGIDSGLIDLVIIGRIDETKLKDMTKKTEILINRKIRSLVLEAEGIEKLYKRLNLKHAIRIWGEES